MEEELNFLFKEPSSASYDRYAKTASSSSSKAMKDGDVRLVSEEDCWIQDVWMEMLTEEGELLHEDEEGRWAYGFGYGTVLNGLDSEEANEEIYARTREKLTKRDYIEPDSIKTSITTPDRKGRRTLRVTYSPLDAEKEVNKDIRIDGAEVTIE